MSASVALTSLTFNDGSVVETRPGEVLVIVGPNSSGKSQSLRDIAWGLHGDPVNTVVTGWALQRTTDRESVAEFVKSATPRLQQGDQNYFIGRPREGGGGTNLENIVNSFFSRDGQLGHASWSFVLLADAATRLTAADPVSTVDLRQEDGTSPLHRLFRQPALEERLDVLTRRAFGHGVALDRFGGQRATLCVGDRPTADPVQDMPTYVAQLSELPPVSSQGDGVRSFVGLVLDLVAGSHPIVLVDEPEAFLHPPQARLVGQLLAEEAGSGKQVVVATHSSDVLEGVLSTNARTTVVRLRRDGGVNRASVLSPDDITTLWSDPLLRYSNALDGLFHDLVVVCEADSDARFYQSIADLLPDNEDGRRRPDVLFTHCGGKARLHVLAGALLAVDVPVRVVPDIDVLNETQPLRRIVESLGGDADAIEADRKIIAAAVSSLAKQPPLLAVRDELDKILSGNGSLAPAVATKAREVLKTDSGWGSVKRGGYSALPNGDAREAAERADELLRQIGVFVVPVGELERWVNAAGHGPEWLANVYESGTHEKATQARDFVRDVLNS